MARSRVGSVQEVRPGVWRVRVQRGRRADGSPRVVQETYRGTSEGAHARAASIAAALGRSDAYADGLTLSAFYWSVFRDRPSNRGATRAPATLAYYDQQMERNVLPTLGGVEVSRITHEMAAACVNASTSPLNTRRTLSAVMRTAYDLGVCAENVMARRIPVERRRREQVAPWSAPEVRDALEVAWCAPREIRAYMALGLSGLRKEECLGARARDVGTVSTRSWGTGEVSEVMTVAVSWTYTDAGGHVPRAKNSHSLRTVPVFPPLRDTLAGCLDGLDPDERVIPWRGDETTKRWRAWCSSAGLRPIPPDLLRHTSDTLALVSGVAPDLSDKMHGRSEHASTYQNYFRPDVAAMEEAAQSAARALGLADGGGD